MTLQSPSAHSCFPKIASTTGPTSEFGTAFFEQRNASNSTNINRIDFSIEAS